VIAVVTVLAALGGGAAFYLSRRKTEAVDTAAADSVAWYATLASRLRRKPKAILIPEEGAGGT
jgi:type II secretory pathway pseudopilin PulG